MARKFKRTMSLILTVLILLTSVVGVNAQVPDVKGHWAANTIAKWYDLGLTNGTSSNTFSPNNNVTRAELATYLNKIFNFTEISDLAFSDVSEASWYHNEIGKAVAAGIIIPKAGKVVPLNKLTRQEVAQMIVTAFGWKSSPIDNLEAFVDSSKIEASYRDALNVLVGKGFIIGRPEKKLAPLDKITRAEVIVMIDNAMGELRNVKGSYSQNAKGNLVVNIRDVVLSNMTIEGNLYLTQGIGNGEVTLENVKVKGDTIVSGGGMESIKIKNSSLTGKLIIIKVDGKVRIVAEGSSEIGGVELKSGAKLEELNVTGGGFRNIEVLGEIGLNQEILLDGNFDQVSVLGNGANVTIVNGLVGKFEVDKLAKDTNIKIIAGTITELNASAAAKVTGKGSILTANIKAAGVNIEQKPTKIIVAVGFTAMVGGTATTGTTSNAGNSNSTPNSPNPTPNPTPDPTPDTSIVAGTLFDDFNYLTSNDVALEQMGWIVKDTKVEGPGPAGCTWSKNNVTFITDPTNEANKLVRFTSSTDGTSIGTNQAEISTQRKFFEGTYAARVKFNDTPLEGASKDGDALVQTFFTITPLDFDMDPYYSECDFEYLPNGGWGGPRMMYETTWETYMNEPWTAVNSSTTQADASYEGWHDLVLNVSEGVCKYYIDGTLVSDHSGQYYPEGPMTINFNQWFISGGFNEGLTGIRTYQQDIDWVYFAEDKVLTTEEVNNEITKFRSEAIKSKDTVVSKNPNNVPVAATLIVDKNINTGSYVVTSKVPANNNATEMKLFKDGVLVEVKPVVAKLSTEQSFNFNVSNSEIGTFKYIAELSNFNGTTQSTELVVTVVKAMFDDFSYDTSSDEGLGEMGWSIKETTSEGPGPMGATWSKDNVTFETDSENPNNKLARLTSSTDGTVAGTNEAEIVSQRKFFEGTYAARIRFSDTPVEGAAKDGDAVVQTFFSITPLDFDLDPNYSECDFEYLPNGGWGGPPLMYETTWETYQNDPWLQVRDYSTQEPSFEGWHDLVFTVKDGHVSYYIDGILVADHTDQNYPEGPMTINFNQWFSSISAEITGTRIYQEDIDWVYFAEDVALTTDQVKAVVSRYRLDSVQSENCIEAKDLANKPQAASISVDSPVNSGNYAVTVTVPVNNNAKTMRLYENGKLVLVENLTVNASDTQVFPLSVEDKTISMYNYIAELSNSNGTTTSAAIVVEVAGGNLPFNAALNKSAIGSEGALALDPKAINDGIVSDSDTAISGVGEGIQWAQIDLAKSYDVNKVNLWHYFADGRTYHDVIVQLSNTQDFSSGVTTVFNDDKDNSAGFGIGSDVEYAETLQGKTIHFNTINARYIRLYTNGLTKPLTDLNNPGQNLPYNHYVEVQVWTAGGDEGAAKLSVDNIYSTGDYTLTVTVPEINEATTMNLYENGIKVIDAKTVEPNEVITNIKTNMALGSYTYKVELVDSTGVKTSSELVVTVKAIDNTPSAASLSVDTAENDGNYTLIVTIPSGNTATSLQLYENGLAIGEAHVVTPSSITTQVIKFPITNKPSGSYKYKVDLINESGTTPSVQITVKVIAAIEDGTPTDVALFKTVSGSAVVDESTLANALLMTDGDLNTFAGPGEGEQWVQIDFGQSYNVNKVKLWHYFVDGRKYNDVIVQLSNDATFKTGVTTVFNNNDDVNTYTQYTSPAAIGLGNDGAPYAESSEGKIIEFGTINARYIRLYSNGSIDTGYPPANHYSAVEVWTAGN